MPVPNDLLRHVIDPTPYASAWLWVAVASLTALIAWYAAIFRVTSSTRRLRDIGLIGTARDEMIKRRSVRTIRSIGKHYRTGELAPAAAAAALGHELRRYLQEATGLRARYMHVGAVESGRLAPAAPVLSEIVDIQFNQHSGIDIAATCDAAEELVRQWT
jgi:hypothetical protein